MFENDPIQDFIFSTKDYNNFFKSEDLDKNIFTTLPILNAENIMTSAIIKEAKYNEYFMSWEKGKNILIYF